MPRTPDWDGDMSCTIQPIFHAQTEEPKAPDKLLLPEVKLTSKGLRGKKPAIGQSSFGFAESIEDTQNGRYDDTRRKRK